MKILVLGHKGMLGTDLMARLGGRHEVLGRDIDEFNIASADSCRDLILELHPQVVINAAAFTDVDGCETNRETCMAVNAGGVRNVALACEEISAKVVHLSTDYVFDGTRKEPYREDDSTSPLNVYGHSKLEGENLLRSSSTRYILIRTAWLYGVRGKNFVKTIIQKAKTEKQLRVVDDQIGSPTFTWDLAGAIMVLVEGDHTGLFHVTNRGVCSWYEFACKIIQYKGLSDVTVTPIKSDQLPRPAVRPPYSVLNCRKFMDATGKVMPFWHLSLQECLAKMPAAL
jgi:dTDP-4-dehydrorhamnose reductase